MKFELTEDPHPSPQSESSARETCGGRVFNIESAEDVCDEAKRLTDSDRNVQYGDPSINFLETAQLWSTYLGHPISPSQVGVCQVLLKIARDKHTPKRDNIVDGIGYLRCVQRVRESEN